MATAVLRRCKSERSVYITERADGNVEMMKHTYGIRSQRKYKNLTNNGKLAHSMIRPKAENVSGLYSVGVVPTLRKRTSSAKQVGVPLQIFFVTEPAVAHSGAHSDAILWTVTGTITKANLMKGVFCLLSPRHPR